MTLNKTQLAISIAAASFSLAIVAPQVQADASVNVSSSDAAQQADALQNQMQQMSDSMKSMQSELDRLKAASNNNNKSDAKVQELDQWMSSMKHSPEAVASKDNLVDISGGWEQLDYARSYNNPLANGGLLSNNQNSSGFYVGGIFDFDVNNDLFGLVDDTSFMVELGFEYSQFGTGKNTLTALGGPALASATINPGSSLDSRLRLNASPKIKFMHGSKLRPWIIPIGLEINILGVPSNAVSVLNSGMQFGGGAEYDIWRGIVLGADARYHYATSTIDGTNTNGVSLGGYVGFKF
jgi:opacity protein-like surface antigen